MPKVTRKSTDSATTSTSQVDDTYDEDAPIYDDCNDIRRKIRQHLQLPEVKVTHFLRELGNINSNTYQRFMKKTGPTGGAESSIYPAAYHFFEKKRIAEGKPKSKKRKDAEDIFPGGRPLEDGGRRKYFCAAGDSIVQNKWGQVRAVPGVFFD